MGLMKRRIGLRTGSVNSDSTAVSGECCCGCIQLNIILNRMSIQYNCKNTNNKLRKLSKIKIFGWLNSRSISTCCNNRMESVIKTTINMQDTREAVSSFPMGGSIFRNGRINGLVVRVIICVIGLRKFPLTHCKIIRIKKRLNTRLKMVSIKKIIARIRPSTLLLNCLKMWVSFYEDQN